MIILDLDNTIANDGWRIPKIDWSKKDPAERYHPYHAPSGADKPGNTHLFEGTERNIVIFTARPEAYRAVTEVWLTRQGIYPAHMYMRAMRDHRPSKLIKADFLFDLFRKRAMLPSDIFCAYDDRPDVVDMFKMFGVNSQLVSIHSVCAYTNPNEEKAA